MKPSGEHSVSINRLLSADRLEAITVSDKAFGPDYIDNGSFSFPKGISVLFKATINGDLVGYTISYLCPAGEMLTRVFEGKAVPDLSKQTLSADQAGRLGVIKTVAVDPTLQGQGIGTALVKKAEIALKNKGASEIIVPAWQKGDGSLNIGGLLDKNRYERRYVLKQFWKTECDAQEFQCTERNRFANCMCSAVFFTKSLKVDNC